MGGQDTLPLRAALPPLDAFPLAGKDLWPHMLVQVDAMAAQIKGREAELAGLSPEHRNAEIANMMRQMVNASLQVGQAPCCGSGDCKAPTLQQGAGGGGVCDLPPGAGAGGGVGAGEEVSRAAGGAGQWQAAGNNMSQEDQMRFFQALSQAPS